MYVAQFEPLLAVGASEGTIFTIEGTSAQERRVVIENLDVINTMTFRYEFSDDAITWTDEDPDAPLAAGSRFSTALIGHIFYRLRASGSLNIAVRIDTEKALTGATFITR